MCSCASFVMYCVMLYGLLACAACASVCLFVLRVIVRIVCDVSCGVAWFACFLDWLKCVRVLCCDVLVCV